MNPTLLALDTSTEACSAALLLDGEIRERYELAPRAHARLILGMVEALLAEAGLKPRQLDAIAFGRGPGAFTGVRIATGVVQGIAFAAELPVIPVSSLAALAQDAMEQEDQARVLAAIDARMGELYWGVYRRDASGHAQRVGEEQVAQAAEVLVPAADTWLGVGSGWGAHADALRARLGERLIRTRPEVFPRARAIARLGIQAWREHKTVAPEQAVPVYLRNRVVHSR